MYKPAFGIANPVLLTRVIVCELRNDNVRLEFEGSLELFGLKVRTTRLCLVVKARLQYRGAIMAKVSYIEVFTQKILQLLRV